MAYSVKADLQRIAKSEDITKLSQASDSNITAAITDADDLIDIQLGGVYIIPLSPIDKMITRISAEIAIYYLYTTYLNLSSFDGDGAKYQGYKRAEALLKQIRKKEITLSSALIDNKLQQTIIVTSTSTKKFSDTILAKY